MGVVLGLRTKYKHKELIKKNVYLSLSKSFGSFIDIYPVGKNNEFDQVEKILDINLRLFHERSNNTEPDITYLDLQRYDAAEQGNQKKADSLQVEIDKVVEQWKLDYPNDMEGWVLISDLRQLVNNFLSKIRENTHYYAEMEFNLKWESYFNPDGFIIENKITSSRNNLITDLNAILEYLDKVEIFGCELVTFEYQ